MAEFAVVQAFDLVKAWFTTKGSQLEHLFGSEHVDRHRSPNSYIWVPLKSALIERDVRRSTDVHAGIWQTWEHVSVRCWGASHDEAFTMACNVNAALLATVGSANYTYVGGTWDDVTEGESPVGVGRLLIAEFAIRNVMADRYVPIGRYAGAPQTPIAPTVPLTDITSIEITNYSSPDGSTDGELGGVDVVVPPEP